jgi:hypothetical protein
MKTKIRNKKLAIGIFAVFIAFTMFATGALLTHFGQVTTKAEVGQSIQISKNGNDWYNYDHDFGTTLVPGEGEEMIHCTPHWYKYWIRNRACQDACIDILINWKQLPAPGADEGYELENYIVGDTQTIRLVQKDIVWGQSPWTELDNGLEAFLTINTCGKNFEYTIEYEDLNGDYSLIYYANYPEYWDAAPATVLDTFTADGSGVYTNWKSTTPTMPYEDDENTQRPISDLGETYEHQYGAKFWLVPVDAVTDGEVNWDMAEDFLFETDLGLYVDCDEIPPTDIPLVYAEFHTNILKAETTYCWLNWNHVVMNAIPGTYQYSMKIALCQTQQVE